jgi:hypothetical protein
VTAALALADDDDVDFREADYWVKRATAEALALIAQKLTVPPAGPTPGA